MGGLELGAVDRPLCGPDAACGLKAADKLSLGSSHKPVPRWHGRPVVQEGGVQNDDRDAGGVTDHYLEGSLGRPAE
jgi:hypothetical protein